jgi:hypothetical protein
MDINKEYSQVYLRHDTEPDALAGKTIDKVFMTVSKEYYDQNEVIITFTDKTFIVLGINDASEYLEEDRRPVIASRTVVPPQCYNGGRFEVTKDDNDNYRFKQLVQNRVDAGLWRVTPEEAIKLQEDYDRRYEEGLYRQYLRLKDRFDGRDDEFKDIKQ